MDKSKITLKKYGESMHLMPNGEEGYKYSVEEAYKILLKTMKIPDRKSGKANAKRKENSQKNGHDEKCSQDEAKGGGTGGGESKEKKTTNSTEQTKSSGGAPTLEALIASIKARNSAISESLKKEGDLTKLSRLDCHLHWNLLYIILQ